jgi:Ca2+-binding RTX toxin-like protein
MPAEKAGGGAPDLFSLNPANPGTRRTPHGAAGVCANGFAKPSRPVSHGTARRACSSDGHLVTRRKRITRFGVTEQEMIMARIDGGWGFTYWQKDRLFGTSSADEIRANGGDDFVDGGGGADKIWMGEGDDTAFGGSGRDSIWGENGNDILNGESGDDILYGGNGNDTLDGGGDDDTLDGGTGNDSLFGSTGQDVLDGGFGNDTVAGGDIDTIDYTNFYGKVSINLGTGSATTSERFFEVGVGYKFTQSGTATISGIEKIIGSSYDDAITGSGENDILLGGSGSDTVSGGGGNDTISGGKGLDTLTGGSGQDVFVFNTAINGSGNADRDFITDFNVIDDTIQLDNAIFTAIGGNGQLVSDAFHRIDGSVTPTAAAQDAEDRIIYDSFRGDIYYDADGTGSIGAVWIARVNEGTNLSVSDFFII